MKVIIKARDGYITRDGMEFPCGMVAEFDDHLAVKLCNYGIAGPAPQPKVETAAKAAPAHAAKHVGKATKKTAAPIVPEVKEDEDA